MEEIIQEEIVDETDVYAAELRLSASFVSQDTGSAPCNMYNFGTTLKPVLRQPTCDVEVDVDRQLKIRGRDERKFDLGLLCN